MSSARFESKILSRAELVAAVAAGRLPRPLVFTNGVFDILHRGHVTYLDQAAQLGATLVVAVNTDESVRRLGKGSDRPLNQVQDRAALLAALGCVDAVTSFHEDTPQELIGELRPDLIVKGGDYDMDTLPETALVRSWGGRAVAIPFDFERSTTALLGKIRQG
ncbi:D-glycero-beta-D-manno-heptose 1-phosphate adenylyltransferase [Bordetella bronchiseptica]|uniref:D-glycero-beta-D-manno-heptose 1-phosphate adenylyltransferase n=1 Tax=Bordetella bronchiseptica TaxID=518 RepID=UPI000460D7FB|nr:D-glycero-beta-D-manno-heptose 1-phosphate adenylyltransferase [Bordetella bronchiseptica]AWP81805.1 D-beta-D-heptose 1-phosphate adenylyltransferase [Bordetella bronchiseptica]KDC42905.1 bifunctional protein RfaE, domain II [Bordetella bronchiseptica M435/02/3]SUV71476.1 cytidylyltransferase [Bordetella bronchiseptica]VEI27763.1 cytidylyltransferase [Bordetella bronchiseptica]